MKTKRDWNKEKLEKIAEAEKRVKFLEENYDGKEVLSFISIKYCHKQGRFIPFVKLIKAEDEFHLVEVLTPDKKARLIRHFFTINDFWNYFITDKNWYKNRPKEINPILFKRIIELTNHIRLTQDLSVSELKELSKWNDQNWDKFTRVLLKGRCPNCNVLSGIYGYLCSECTDLITDLKGRKITLNIGGNYYTETKEEYYAKFGFLNNKKVITQVGPMDSYFYIFSEGLDEK